MYVGGHSWVAVVVLVGVMAMRMLSAQRRRNGRPGAPHGSRTAAGFAPTAGTSRAATPDPGATSTGTAPGWFVDPFVRHEQRYWSGTAWTEHVLDGGVPAVDPPPPPRVTPT